ncbi:FN3 associated domain-containing protein [Foetidibacter luteolus]|uniref:FN3 associated domain-containing protein n=1 Tax=Foetidibacter luteolus TaxID=2608880 RepID=UPI00129AA9F0|nr:FN3 associated domain-containing protein [Foetidibacter luteolus]
MKFKNILAASLIPFNTLLLFFLLVEGRLDVPAWLQVFGRMHPLVLHFPIVLILLYAAMLLVTPAQYKKEHWFQSGIEWMLLFASVTSAVTALMGLLLSREPGYDADAIALHKYTGILTSLLLFIMYSSRKWLATRASMAGVLVVVTAGIVIWAGHLGGNITHGENFVLLPVTPDNTKPPVALEDAVLYADLVEPVFQAKCMGCHNNSKAKGELVMDTKELLLKGGKNGKLWDTTKPDLGLLMHRIHLPLEEKEHMPPKGKPQLTEEETAIIYAWIKGGAAFDKRVIELPVTDTLRVLASKVLKQSTEEQYSFASADEKQIQKLSNNNRVITPLSLVSPALVVNFYNKPFYNIQQLEDLKPLAEQIVELNLDNMPVKDEDLKVIGSFKNLRKLNLNFTGITGATLGELKNLQFLKSLSLSGTAVKPSHITVLTGLPKLRTVYLWNTPVLPADAAELEKQNKNIAYQTGFKGADTMILKLTPPILQNEEQVITTSTPLKLKHYINGAIIRYTFDGSEPDSISSPIYKSGVSIDSELTVKTKAFKPGWISSDVVQQHFFKSGFKPDSAVLLTASDSRYSATGAKTLIDLEKSELNFSAGKWLGFQQNAMEAKLFYSKPVTAQTVTLSLLQNIGPSIMPPYKVTVMGSTDDKNWATLATVLPKQPGKDDTNEENLAIVCRFKPVQVKYIKLLVQPVASLPAWHQNKGAKGWVFIDEVFVN